MAEFKLPDPKKTSGRVLGIGVLGALGLVVWYYLVPFLAAMAWNTVSLAVACVIVGILGTILLSPTFWKRMSMILQALGNILFGWFIEMNPFTILEMQLDKSEDDRQELFKQAGKLKAQEAKLKEQLDLENETMTLAAKKMEICKAQLRAKPQDENTGYELESASNDFTNSKDFIDKVGPIAGDITRLVTFADKAFRKSGYALKNAKSTVQKQRAAYEAVTAGSNATSKASRAFTGDPEMNKAADIALNKLKSDIAEKIGTIKNCIAETSSIMNERDLNDAAKVQLAADKIELLNIDQTFDYVSQVEMVGQIPTTVNQGNKWLDTLKK